MKESALKRELFLMGLSPKHKGFHYISAAMQNMIEGGALCDPCGAGRDCIKVADTDKRQAECCMRYAINYAWDVNNGRIHLLFPDSKFPPTPVEFLNAFLWSIDDK